MKIKELIKNLSSPGIDRHLEENVSVLIAKPSYGPLAHCHVKSVSFGFDWNKGLLIRPELDLVPKSDKEKVFDMAFDLIAYIGTKPNKKQSYEIKEAKRILLFMGWDDVKFKRVQKLFHGVR